MNEAQISINNRDSIINVAKAISNDVSVYVHRDQLTLTVPMDKYVEVATELKNNPATQFNMCVDITAIDWNRPQKRFEVVCILYSLEKNHRVRLKVAVEEDNCYCPTLSGVWESANWYERETYDMYGIKFINHPDMRRFYMPEDYVDPETNEPIYPLRKDFPLTGIPGSLPLPPYPEKYGEIE